MAVFEKRPFVVLLLGMMIFVAQSDYFAGLTINQTLVDEANKAMDSLKTTLEKYLDCSDDDDQNKTWKNTKLPKLESIYPKNDQPTKSPFHRQSRRLRGESGHFKRNFDRTAFRYRYSTIRTQFAGFSADLYYRDLYNKAKKVAESLTEIKSYLVNYNNVIVGSNNSVHGNHNVVIGSRNSLSGSNYWVFGSDISEKAEEDGVLIIEGYLIELLDIPQILKNPSQVIRCINPEQSNARFKSWWGHASPYCKMCL